MLTNYRSVAPEYKPAPIGSPTRSRRTRRLLIGLLILAVLVPGTVYGLNFLFTQHLGKPPSVPARIVNLCPSLSTLGLSLVNVTDPNPLISGLNGTAVYGCGFNGSGVGPAVQILSTGTVNPILNLPAGINLYLLSDPTSLGPQSQAQCAQGVQLTNATSLSLPLGSYAYCESAANVSNMVPIDTSWYEA